MSSSSSYSTSSSSSGPYTPPVSYAALPGPTPFLPRYNAAMKPGRAHNLLAYSLNPVLNYDISLPPSTIFTPVAGLGLPAPAGMLDPAVYPPRRALSLVTPHLPWDIPVNAANGQYVTVADVLHAVHSSLRANITPREFGALGAPRNQRRVTDAYVRRFARLRGRLGYSEEKRQGVKRVDFLMGCTTFMGISPVAGNPDLWELKVS